MIKFGVAGNSDSFFNDGYSHTVEVPSWLKRRNLDVFEYSFGRGVKLSEPTAKKIKEEFEKNDILITVHAPYYINFANPDNDKIQGTYKYLLDSLQAVAWLGGNRVVFHPGAVQKQDRAQAVNNAFENLRAFIEVKNETGFKDKIICAETMGKQGQIGTVDEIIRFCNIDDSIYPCVDFGHINAREQGILKTSSDYEAIIKKLIDEIGEEKTKHMHVHFSKIEYSVGGEVRHLTFSDNVYGPEFPPLADILVKYGLEPIIISESAGTQAEDSAFMKETYLRVLNKGM